MEEFHVFLSHNSKDKPAVAALKKALKQHGCSAWLDMDELRPGSPTVQSLETGLKQSLSVAVLVGGDGLGPWEEEEMAAAIRLAVKAGKPCIPVLLPGAPAEPELPLFLANRTWVDLRTDLGAENIGRLVWGITGVKPNTSAAAEPPVPSAFSADLPATDDSRRAEVEHLTKLLDMTVPVTEAVTRRSAHGISCFLLTGHEDHHPESFSYRLAFDLPPDPRILSKSQKPRLLDLKPLDLVSYAKPSEALIAAACSACSLQNADLPSLADHLGKLRKPQVFYIKTYPSLHFQPNQLKQVFDCWERDVARAIQPKPILVLLLEIDQKPSESPGGFLGFFRRKENRPDFHEQYRGALQQLQMEVHILPQPEDLSRDHLKSWFDELALQDYPWIPERDKLLDAAGRLFSSGNRIAHASLGSALKALLLGTH